MDFLGYLDSWERSVLRRPGKFTAAERKRMLFSTETLLGIWRTGMSIINFSDLIIIFKL